MRTHAPQDAESALVPDFYSIEVKILYNLLPLVLCKVPNPSSNQAGISAHVPLRRSPAQDVSWSSSIYSVSLL